jgi:phosphate:Na+ symporter
MILALQLIMQATAPLSHAAGVQVLFSQLSGDVLLDVLLGTLLALLSYSSLAVVLLVATLTASSVITPQVALAVVLGANLGGGLLAVLTTLRADPVARRVPLGNLLFKVSGCLIALPLLGYVLPWLAQLSADPKTIVVNFHLAFNLMIALLFVQVTGTTSQWVERWLPAPDDKRQPGTPRHLDATALDTPPLAIGNAAREAIRIADIVQEMLDGLALVLRNNDFQLAERLRKRDDEIDRLYTAIKLYLTQVSREALEARESQRWTDIIQFTINMEHAGDMFDRILVDVVEKKIQHGLSFSEAGMLEIDDLLVRLSANLKLAVAVFLNGDLKSAQRLIAEKVNFRELEMKYADRHLLRLSGNSPQSVETSSLHLDLLADLKRINSLFCSIGYPILDSAGVLSRSRVRKKKERAQSGEPPATPETLAGAETLVPEHLNEPVAQKSGVKDAVKDAAADPSPDPKEPRTIRSWR